MSARRAVWEVARREIVERSRSRALHISLAVLLLFAVGGAVAAARLRGHTPTDTIAVSGARSVALEPAIRLQAKAVERRVHVRQLSNGAAAREVRSGTVALSLIDGDRILVKSSGTGPVVREVQNAVAAQSLFDRLRRTGLTQAQALNALSPAALPIDVLAPNARNTPDNQNLILFCVFALYAMVMFSGQAVAQGVTEEKSSRVVELLLTTISPRRLLAGKVLGIGAIGLGLMLLPGAAALVAGSLAGGAGLPPAAPKAIALVVLWFVLGYILFSVAYAAVGATVSRQEDLATAQAPLLIVAIAGLVLANIVTASSPDGTLANVTAFLPPFSPMIVPARMVVGHMSWLAFTTAVAVDLLATAALILLAARIYERSILQTGARVKLTHVLTIRPARPKTETRNMKTKERERAEAAAALEPVDGSRAASAERLSPPKWYYPAYGLLVGGFMAMMPQDLGGWVMVPVVLAFTLGMIWLQGVYREATGFSISGIPWGRPLGWAIALVLVLVGLFLAGLALRGVWGWVGPVLAGIVAVPVVMVGQQRYDTAVRGPAGARMKIQPRTRQTPPRDENFH